MDAIKDLKQCSFHKLHGLCIDIFNIVVGAFLCMIGGIHSLIGASFIIMNVASIIYTLLHKKFGLQYHGKTSRLLMFYPLLCHVVFGCYLLAHTARNNGYYSTYVENPTGNFSFIGIDKQID